jgi:hypothetical protein
MKDTLLKEQLAASGLEMQIEPISAILGGIGAVTGIAQGIFGASEASKANAKAKAYQKEQQKLLNEQAKLQNKYNKKKFEAEKANYYKQLEYNFDTAIEKWKYDKSVKALQEEVDAQKYLMSVENTQKQLTFNEIAAQSAQNSEQLALNDAMSEYAFERQDLLLSQLQAEGKAQLGQAGKSFGKRLTSEQANIGRALAVMSASLTGEVNASTLRLFDITQGKFAADAKAIAAQMLMPKKLPDIPAPTQPPEPKWVEPMKILPGMAAPAQTQSVFAPLISGISQAASGLSSIDWSSPNDGGKFNEDSGWA